LEVCGRCLTSGDSSIQPQIPLVHLPALKHLVFVLVYVDEADNFLTMFQIPETLETLFLIQAERTEVSGGRATTRGSETTPIFNLLANLGSEGSKNKDPSKPWISTLGLKILSIFLVSWVS